MRDSGPCAGRYQGWCRLAVAALPPPATAQQALAVVALVWAANLALGLLHSILAEQPGPKIIAMRRTTSGRNIAVAVDQPPESGIRSIWTLA